jgi:small subunit ribosomal protein S21
MREFQSLERYRVDTPRVVPSANTPEALDRALVTLKKSLMRDGTFREMKRRTFYVKPSAVRRLKHVRAVKSARKRAAKAAERDARYGDRKRN